MFSAGLEFALGLGAGCLLLYSGGLGCIFLWFKLETILKRRKLAKDRKVQSSVKGVAARRGPVQQEQVVELKRTKSN